MKYKIKIIQLNFFKSIIHFFSIYYFFSHIIFILSSISHHFYHPLLFSCHLYHPLLLSAFFPHSVSLSFSSIIFFSHFSIHYLYFLLCSLYTIFSIIFIDSFPFFLHNFFLFYRSISFFLLSPFL